MNSFVHQLRWYNDRFSGGHYVRIAYIDLENNKYEDYKWFRMFFDYEVMKSEIAYTFEDGVFGLRVLKHYEFVR